MPARMRQSQIGAARGRATVAELMREARDARLRHSVAQREVAAAIRLSRSQYSRIERGLVPSVSVLTTTQMLAVVGLELSARAYPSGDPIRDAAHSALLDRLRRKLSRSLTWMTEVPLPHPGDRRAWDAVIAGRDAVGAWRLGVEAETRPRDFQALERRVALKERDGGVEAVLLLLANTRHNRAFVRDHSSLVTRFPVTSRRTLESLTTGARPEGNAVMLR
jgi:transcriptional regulator with XRE-family HTH domain